MFPMYAPPVYAAAPPAAAPAKRSYRRRNYRGTSYQKLKRSNERMKTDRKRFRDWIKSTGPVGVPGSVRQQIVGPTYQSAEIGQRHLRRAAGYYGPGDYKSTLGRYIPPGSFSKAGSWLGSATGIPGLGSLGGWAGDQVSKYVGFGDYGPVSTNQIIDSGSGAQQLVSVNPGDRSGDICLDHTSFVANVIATTGDGVTASPFEIQGYDLNPGLVETFPWLSQIASNYELYDWEGLIFQFKPTSGEFGSSTSNALGKIIMVTRYGVNQDTSFANSIEMLNYDYSNSSKPSCGMLHGVETDNRKQNGGEMLMVRTGPPTESRTLFDVGKFYIATEGIPMGENTTAIVGELWVTYKLRLSRAKLSTALGDSIEWARVRDIATSSAMSTAPLISAQSTFNVIIENTNSTSATVTIPANQVTSGDLHMTLSIEPASGTSVVLQQVDNLVNIVRYTRDQTLQAVTGAPSIGDPDNRAIIQDDYFKIPRPDQECSFRVRLTGELPSGNHIVSYLFNQYNDAMIVD